MGYTLGDWTPFRKAGVIERDGLTHDVPPETFGEGLDAVGQLEFSSSFVSLPHVRNGYRTVLRLRGIENARLQIAVVVNIDVEVPSERLVLLLGIIPEGFPVLFFGIVILTFGLLRFGILEEGFDLL